MSPLRDMLASRPGEHLAGFYENECEEAWERTVATWTCDCGQTYKVLPGGLPGRPDDRFYRIVEDGVLGALVGTTRGIGISHNKACPAADATSRPRSGGLPIRSRDRSWTCDGAHQQPG